LAKPKVRCGLQEGLEKADPGDYDSNCAWFVDMFGFGYSPFFNKEKWRKPVLEGGRELVQLALGDVYEQRHSAVLNRSYRRGVEIARKGSETTGMKILSLI
jgi:hypothetical protein